jgi:TnpA family transposase
MARRRALTDEQLEELLALPASEPVLIRHWTLSSPDIAVVERRRGDPNQLGFALQLCAFRYPAAAVGGGHSVPALCFVPTNSA